MPGASLRTQWELTRAAQFTNDVNEYDYTAQLDAASDRMRCEEIDDDESDATDDSDNSEGRDEVDTPGNENEPDTFAELASYLGREQYGCDVMLELRPEAAVLPYLGLLSVDIQVNEGAARGQSACQRSD